MFNRSEQGIKEQKTIGKKRKIQKHSSKVIDCGTPFKTRDLYKAT
jgi:hypothetical protein